MSSRSLLSWIWTGLVLVTSIALVLAVHDSIGGIEDAMLVLTPTLLAALGAVIITRQRGNRIGWLMIVVSAGLLIEPAAILELSGGKPEPVTVVDVLAIVGENTAFFVGFIIPIALLLYLFPSGRYLTRRWSWAGWLALVSSVGFLGSSLFSTEMTIYDADWTVINPLVHLPARLEAAFTFVSGIAMLPLLIAGIAAIVARYRRSDFEVRSQIRLVSLSLVFFIAVVLYRLLTDDRGSLSGLLFGLSTVSIPISITLAILRYRLFDIDRLISRTVGYVIVVGVLALVYVAGAVWLPTQITGGGSPLFVAASTLAAAALFNPLRRHVIKWIDRRFNRSRYDTEEVLSAFGEHLKDEIDVDQITAESLALIHETLQPASVGAWIKE